MLECSYKSINQYGMENRIDMAFITTGFKPLDGVGLAKMLLDRYPEVRLVFVVDDSQWEYVRRLPNSRHWHGFQLSFK